MSVKLAATLLQQKKIVKLHVAAILLQRKTAKLAATVKTVKLAAILQRAIHDCQNTKAW